MIKIVVWRRTNVALQTIFRFNCYLEIDDLITKYRLACVYLYIKFRSCYYVNTNSFTTKLFATSYGYMEFTWRSCRCWINRQSKNIRRRFTESMNICHFQQSAIVFDDIKGIVFKMTISMKAQKVWNNWLEIDTKVLLHWCDVGHDKIQLRQNNSGRFRSILQRQAYSFGQ